MDGAITEPLLAKPVWICVLDLSLENLKHPPRHVHQRAFQHPAGSCRRDDTVIIKKEHTLPARGQRPGGVCCRTKDRNSYSACCNEILLSFTALVRPDCKKRAVNQKYAPMRETSRNAQQQKVSPSSAVCPPACPEVPPECRVSIFRVIPLPLLSLGISASRPD